MKLTSFFKRYVKLIQDKYIILNYHFRVQSSSPEPSPNIQTSPDSECSSGVPTPTCSGRQVDIQPNAFNKVEVAPPLTTASSCSLLHHQPSFLASSSSALNPLDLGMIVQNACGSWDKLRDLVQSLLNDQKKQSLSCHYKPSSSQTFIHIQ